MTDIKYINVCDGLDSHIDFTVTVSGERNQYNNAIKVVNAAYDEWFKSYSYCNTVTEYISDKLNELGIEHEIYFHMHDENEDIF